MVIRSGLILDWGSKWWDRKGSSKVSCGAMVVASYASGEAGGDVPNIWGLGRACKGSGFRGCLAALRLILRLLLMVMKFED